MSAPKKYCSCVGKVAAKQTDKCLASRKWGTKKCVNPYAVCRKSTGAKGKISCSQKKTPQQKRKIAVLERKLPPRDSRGRFIKVK